MCLIGFALDAHDDFVLVLAANRDEYYAREAAPAAWWSDRAGTWGGRDCVAGGSWLAVDRHGRLAAVTNVREPGAAPGRRSRGELVADFVGADVPIDAWAQQVAARGDDYAGFNLLLFDPAARRPALYVSNRHPGRVLEVPPGVHGLSNHLLDSNWPKVSTLTRRIAEVLGDARAPLEAVLLEALADRSQPPDEALPDTGVGLARERILAPAMIVAPGLGYGTRASTLVAIRRDGRIETVERGWTPDGDAVRITGDRRARFKATRRIPAR
ncbi:MAG: NRDE family protein [Burkholderiaceae bacterium]|nr:NRDE family protein [Burkholderiaceae bacterium]MEB2351125.1 NRDE family protein [Burkholderiaceae bacterium]